MSAYAPVARTAPMQSVGLPRAAVSAIDRRPTPQNQRDREELRREIERADRQRAQAERARDNAAARHPLDLR